MKYYKSKKKTFMLIMIIVLAVLLGGGLQSYKRYTSHYVETKFLLGTVVTIKAIGPEAKPAVEKGFIRMEELEAIFDQYNQNGLVSKVNHHPEGTAENFFKIPSELVEVIQLGLEYGEKTDGRFDISIGPLSKLWEMKENEGVLPKQKEIDNARRKVDYRKIKLDLEQSTIEFEKGMSLDLGGIAKGYITDQVISRMQEFNISGTVINAGGNILTMGENSKGNWKVGVVNPDETDTLTGYLSFTGEKAVVSAGNYQRFFLIDEKKYGHILNVNSGWPETGVLGVTVIGPHSSEADILATSAFVIGVEAGLEMIQKAGYEGLIIDRLGELYTTQGFNSYFTKENMDSGSLHEEE